MAPELGNNDMLLQFERRRVHAILAALEAMAGGDLSHRVPLSPAGDELDAIAHAVNVLADELRLAKERQV